MPNPVQEQVNSQHADLKKLTTERKELEKKLSSRQTSLVQPGQEESADKKSSWLSKILGKKSKARPVDPVSLNEKLLQAQIKEIEAGETVTNDLRTQQIKLVELMKKRDEAEKKSQVISPALEKQIQKLQDELEKFEQISVLAEQRALKKKESLEAQISSLREKEFENKMRMESLEQEKIDLEKSHQDHEDQMIKLAEDEMQIIDQIKREKAQIRRLLQTQVKLKEHMSKTSAEVQEELKEIEDQILFLINRQAEKPLSTDVIKSLESLNDKLNDVLSKNQ